MEHRYSYVMTQDDVDAYAADDPRETIACRIKHACHLPPSAYNVTVEGGWPDAELCLVKWTVEDQRVGDATMVPGRLGEAAVYIDGRNIGSVMMVVTDYPGVTDEQKTHPYRARFYTAIRFTDLKGAYASQREAAEALVKYSRTHKVRRII